MAMLTPSPNEFVVDLGYRARPWQEELHYKSKRFNFLVIHRRAGKRIPLTTDIPTPDRGFVKLSEIHAGDKVLGYDGKPVNILLESEIVLEDEWIVELDNGNKIPCCREHQWHVERAFSKLADRTPWKNGVVMNTEELHAAIKKESWFIPLPKEAIEYRKARLPIAPYVLGVWLGDGNSDSSYITNPVKEIQKAVGLKNVKNYGSCDRGIIHGLVSQLKKLNLYKNKHIPDIYKLASVEQRKELLAGLMDTDGHAPLRKGKKGSSTSLKYFISNNERFVNDVVELLQSLAIKASVKSSFRKGSVEYTISFSSPFNPFKNELNKFRRFIPRTTRAARYKVVNVYKTNKKSFMKCLTVDGEHSVFLIGKNYVPTHNTFYAIAEMLDKLLRCEKPNPQGAFIAQNYGSAERIAWPILKQLAGKIPGVQFKEGKLTCIIPRGEDKITIFLLGAEKYDSIRGIYLDYGVLDEYAFIPRKALEEVVMPAIMDRDGYLTIMTTPNGKNHAYELYETNKDNPIWCCARLNVYQTGVFRPDQIDLMKATLGEEAFEQEMMVSWSAQVKGAYYKEEMRRIREQKRICRVPHDASVPVDAMFDLGIGDQTAIWFFQQVGKEVHFLKYMEAHGKGLSWYANEMRTQQFPVRGLYLPHDAKARELGTGKTREETLRSLGFHDIKISPKLPIDDGINASRILLERSWFDEIGCSVGIDRLDSYHSEYVELEGVFKRKPVHDVNSHGADAFRTGAVSLEDAAKMARYKTSSLYDDDFQYAPLSERYGNRQVITDYDIYDY